MKYGYALPSLSSGPVDVGETIGTRAPVATCAAAADALEHPAPTMALTPSPLNAACVSSSAAVNAWAASHLESR
eukprot:7376771-Prymnesium_polylepis.1